MKKIVLVGGGGHCASCIDVIEQEGKFQIAGIIDMPDKHGTTLLGYPIIGNDEDLPKLVETYQYFLITLGQIKSPQRRIALFEKLLQLGAQLPTIASPRAYISRHASVGAGTIAMHNSLINAGAKVGVNCIINSCALIEHDAKIGDHCHISTGAIINGGTLVAEGTFVGSGAVAKDNIRIGSRSLIGGGVSVMEEVPDNSLYTGKK
ncbi:MAG: acetyltransferase [Desulfuromonadales bacterium]|nr:acetyltransferase [Desulfuromonadales bacterium]